VSSLENIILDSERGWGEHLEAIRRDVRAIGTGQMASVDVDTWAAGLLVMQGRLQVLCAVRDGPQGVETINSRLAEFLCRRGLLPAAEGWYAGRPVMVTRNDHTLGLMNGDVGLTLPDPRHGGQLRVFFPVPGFAVRSVLPSRLVAVETVFAMTVHKAQGSEFAHAVFVMPERDSPVITRELVYTAVTRAREKVTIVLPAPGLLDTAIRRRVRRSSGLAARLGLKTGNVAAPASVALDVPEPSGVVTRPPSGPTQLDLF
jgi:exodeoxyribonuclease V alpha subunit